jgi:6-phospho-beta-glucosidase
VSPRAWFINFTNPAGLITQALTQNTNLNVIGICDTPSELFHRIAEAVNAPPQDVVCDYAGLNHLGWVRRVHRRGEDITGPIIDDSTLLRSLYPSGLFDPALIQSLRLIPTEYLFFYYSQRKAYRNQLAAGASRGEELARMNQGLFERLSAQTDAEALDTYTAYLQQRNASYMKLEGSGVAAPALSANEPNPFETATGYHRIALDVMSGLVADHARQIVLNVPNHDSIDDLETDDIVEVPCDVSRMGARPRQIGRLPEQVRGLTLSVKAYERTTIRAALEGSCATARLALFEHPSIAQWEVAGEILSALKAADPEHLGYLR